MSVRGTTVSGTVLSATKFRDFLCARYNVSTLNLQSHCEGCVTAFRVTHTLSCSIGGLIIACQKKICDKLLDPYRHDFNSESVYAEPLIHQGRTRSEQDICQGSDKNKDTRGGMMIRGLWDCQVDAIIDVKLGDAEADTYKYEPMTSILTRWENIKKHKHGKHYHDQGNHFSLFALSVDGMLGREALVVLSKLSQVMVYKRE